MTKSGRTKQTMVITQPAKRILNPFDDTIDLSTSDGRKIYKEGTRPLEEKYDGTPEKATFFQTKVIDASESHCWSSIYKLRQDGELIDLLKQPGKISLVTSSSTETTAFWRSNNSKSNRLSLSLPSTYLGSPFPFKCGTIVQEWYPTGVPHVTRPDWSIITSRTMPT